MPTNAAPAAPESRTCPMVRARLAAGLTLEQVSARCHRSVDYLGSLERRGGGAPWILADRLSRLYQCSPTVFLRQKSGAPCPGAQKASKPRRRYRQPGTAREEERENGQGNPAYQADLQAQTPKEEEEIQTMMLRGRRSRPLSGRLLELRAARAQREQEREPEA